MVSQGDINKETILITDSMAELTLHLSKSIISKKIPQENNVLIHFGAFPRLNCPDDIKFDDILKCQEVKLDNKESSIIPFICRKEITEMYWFKPPWSPQLLDGMYEFFVGQSIEDGSVKVTCKNNYFIKDDKYLPPSKMNEKVPFKLIVLTLGICENFNALQFLLWCTYNEQNDRAIGTRDSKRKAKMQILEESRNSRKFETMLGDKDYILVVDFTCFASQDPVRIALPDEESFGIYRKIYTNNPNSSDDVDIANHTKNHRNEMKKIERQLEKYLAQPSPKIDRNSRIICENDIDECVADLINVIHKHEANWQMIHKYGMSCGNSHMPHHASSDEQIKYVLSGVERILKSMQKSPMIIMMTRSKEPSFCPFDKITTIEKMVIAKTKEIFPTFLVEVNEV